MRKEFDPEEVARLILYFEENKFRKDMRKMRNEWYDNFKRNEQEVTDSIRKMTKRYEYWLADCTEMSYLFHLILLFFYLIC